MFRTITMSDEYAKREFGASVNLAEQGWKLGDGVWSKSIECPDVPGVVVDRSRTQRDGLVFDEMTREDVESYVKGLLDGGIKPSDLGAMIENGVYLSIAAENKPTKPGRKSDAKTVETLGVKFAAHASMEDKMEYMAVMGQGLSACATFLRKWAGKNGYGV